MLLIQDVETFTPDSAGRTDLLLAGTRIERIARAIALPGGLADVISGEGLVAVPGLVDGHVHLAGGGGEGGYATRTPELGLGDAIRGGVTTVVGCLGTDGVTRSLEALLARALGLEEEGLSTFILTGSYGVPLVTLTGSVERDLLLVEKVVGAGEVAVSDHRSSQPTFEELARIVADARRGGLLAGKRGVVNFHLGDGPSGLAPLRRLVDETEIPIRQLLPTHVNRNPSLFEEAIAWTRRGGLVDLTTSAVPADYEAGVVKASVGLARMLDAGVDPSLVTFTSDGQGSLPDYDGEGRLRGLGVGRVSSLLLEVRDAVLAGGVPLELALAVATRNPARALGLSRKGVLAEGNDADVVLLRREDLSVHTVVARGRVLMREGRLLAKGTFEA
ncbi:MAG: beta-aspartyl-peptidase [Thermoanaerobaculia bacterium]|nr:beta-aspartyl-peptidase [Thermoanaerobaculia bacterium]